MKNPSKIIKVYKTIPANEKEMAKVLMTWAKRHHTVNTLRTATFMLQDYMIKTGTKDEVKKCTVNHIIRNFYSTAQGEETKFKELMNTWRDFIQKNGTKWVQLS